MITYVILAVTIITSIMAMDNNALKNKMMFNAYMINHHREWYRFLSNGIIHADWPHLIFNMFSLYMFGAAVESEFFMHFGSRGYLFYVLLYVGALVMSSLYAYERHKENVYYNSLGASGAVSAVIFAFILFEPRATLTPIFFPFPIYAWIYGLIFLGVEYYLGKRGNTGIAHDAHFWGAVFGFLFTGLLKTSLFTNFIEAITR